MVNTLNTESIKLEGLSLGLHRINLTSAFDVVIRALKWKE